MLASKNVSPLVRTREDGLHWLSVLAGELYVRLRDAREISEGLWPKSLVLGTRQGRLPFHVLYPCKHVYNPSIFEMEVAESQRSRQTTFPYTKNLSAEYITKYAYKLWDEVAGSMGRASSSKPMKINNVSRKGIGRRFPLHWSTHAVL